MGIILRLMSCLDRMERRPLSPLSVGEAAHPRPRFEGRFARKGLLSGRDAPTFCRWGLVFAFGLVQKMMAGKGVAVTEALAVEIYKRKFAHDDGSLTDVRHGWAQPTSVARMFKTSPKAVRDIWNHVTWKYATKHMWAAPATDLWKGRKKDSKVSPCIYF